MSSDLMHGLKASLPVFFMLSFSLHSVLYILCILLYLFLQWLPPFPGSFRFGKPAWLTPLLAKVESTTRGYLHWWGLIQPLIFVKHYDGMLLQWGALSTLIELWHQQTHTFI